MIVTLIILTIIFGISKAICDTSESGFNSSKLKKLNPLFWDKHKSWVNKWKNEAPEQGEKFPGSSTFLVCITDAWHLFNGLSYLSLFGCGVTISLITTKIYLLLLPFCFGLIVFELTYKLLKD